MCMGHRFGMNASHSNNLPNLESFHLWANFCRLSHILMLEQSRQKYLSHWLTTHLMIRAPELHKREDQYVDWSTWASTERRSICWSELMSFNERRACSRLDSPSLLHASGSHELGEMELTQEPWGRLIVPSHCGSDASLCDKFHRRGPWTSHLLAQMLCEQAINQAKWPHGHQKKKKKKK
jgi:hypothetical protein